MERDEAKMILSLCRPGNSEDRKDPVIAEAIALLDTDAELNAWFANEQMLDAQIADELAKVQPPAELKLEILAGMRAHAQTRSASQDEAHHADNSNLVDFNTATQSTHSEPAKPRPLIPAWAGIAAGVAILCAVVIQQQRAPSFYEAHPVATAGAPQVIDFLANEIERFGFFDFDKRNKEIGPLTTHLASVGTPAPAVIPQNLSQLPTLGCTTFTYGNNRMSMICFKGDKVYHLITADVAAIDCDCSGKPRYFEAHGQSFMLWREGAKAHIIAVDGPIENLPDFI